MKNIHTLLLSLVVLVLFPSCDQLISEIDAPPSEPKLVVYSVISPQDSVVEVRVYKSNPLFNKVNYDYFDNRFPPVTNATVLMSSGSRSVTIPYDEENETYRIDASAIDVEAGMHYVLMVMVPEFSQVSAECTVPEQAPPDIEITGSGFTQETGMEEWYFEFKFKDLPGPGHNYLVNAAILYYDPWMDETHNYFNGFKQGTPLVTDKSNDGGYFYYRTYPNAPVHVENSDKVWVSLSLIDEHYYLYAQSVNNFQDENPFSEPTPVYSNIDGGLGVFAAMNSVLKAVPFE
ncbi:MAG: DUF4249 domain-containing protein [Lentimicrobium sp.]|jgi:hypothetical protein|nr:DUF4249 domain-containing protein [Lentimicrobium sp.]